MQKFSADIVEKLSKSVAESLVLLLPTTISEAINRHLELNTITRITKTVTPILIQK